jgi:hypothetical protein
MLAPLLGCAPTYSISTPAAWAKIGGVSPQPAKSTAPALIASMMAGPELNSTHSTSSPGTPC